MSSSLDARAGSADFTPYAPRLLLSWAQDDPGVLHRAIEGTLVFADVSGFTRLSERLARIGGKSGAEEMTEIIGFLFGELLTVAARRGGEMLKYGGDAVLLFFRGDGHAPRAAAAAHDMQRRLQEIGRVETARGAIRLRMSVGINSGLVDLFKVGGSHEELVVAGPATTETVRVEAAADAGEVLLSAATAQALELGCLGADKDGGRLLRRRPDADVVEIVPSPPTADSARFVSVALRDHLGAGDVDPDHRLATVTFIHAMGLDTVLDELGGTVAAQWLHETMCVIQDACAEFDVSFLATDLAADGTKVMAASGAPSAGDDDERRMLLALRKMIEAAPPLPLRAGVNRGHVFSAAVGPPYRKTYTTMGDVTNTAARVMGRAQAGEVLALRAVLDSTRARFDAEELAPFMAKGKAEPLVPYRVVGLAPEMPEPAAIRLPLTGRDVEVAQLQTAVQSAKAGTGVLVEVVGDMGSGKTRLVEEVVGASGLETFVVHCEPYHRSTPFHPIRRLLEQLVGAHSDPLGAIRAVVEERSPELTPWLSLIAGILDADAEETDETRHLEAEFRLQKTVAVTIDVLRTIRRDTTAFVVEDLHWLDDASAAVLRALEAEVASSPWLVCVTRRNEPSAFTPTSANSSSLLLPPLSHEEMSELVSTATADAPLHPNDRDTIVARAAGNPLFLTELLDHGASAGALPQTLEALMTAQIDRLPSAERRLLRQAAVLGSRFDLKLLAAVADEPSLSLASARAVTSRLQWLCIPEGPGRLRFRHQLIRDVAYESLPFRQRRHLHARAGDAIERASTSNEAAGILSLHFFHAGRHDRCWHYAVMAADRAVEKYANVEAVEILERALAVARYLPHLPAEDLADTWRTLGTRYTLLGSMERAGIAYQRARRLVREQPVRFAELCLREARTAQRIGKADASMRWLGRGLRALKDADDDAASGVRADLALLNAWMRISRGRPRRALRWAELALSEGERANPRAAAFALTLLNNIDAALGRPVSAERAATAVEMLEELGAYSDLAVVLNNLGMDEYYQGRWTSAMALFERARDTMAKVGNVLDAGYCTLSIAEILVEQGHVDAAERDIGDLRPLWQSVDHALGAAFLDNQRARIHAHRGNYHDAIELFVAARAIFDHNQLVGESLDAEARAAECMLRAGRSEDADEAVRAALERDRSAGGTRAAARLHRVLAYCESAAGDLEGAWVSLDESLHLARQSSQPYEVALTLEAFSVLGGSPDGISSEEAESERRQLLDALGVIGRSPRPMPDALLRAERQSPQPVAAPAAV